MNQVIHSGDTRFDSSVQVVVIGAGACGLAAALKATDLGAEVLVIEQDNAPSGSTALSSGFIPAAGTRFQKNQGIVDTAEIFENDIQKKAGGQAEPRLTNAVAHNCGATLEWLADRHGLEWIVIDDFLYPGHSRHRMHAVPERTGAALMTRLVNAAERANIAIATNARVTAIHVDRDQIKGVGVTRSDGVQESIGCEALVMACSGYGGNSALMREYIPEMADALYFGHAGNRGDALLWGLKLGAAVRDLTSYQGHGSVAVPHGILISWALMMQGAIQVNADGKRFANEHRGYSEQAAEVLSQRGGIAWDVYDERIHLAGIEFDDYRHAVEAGAIKSAGDTSDLCNALKLPESSLERTFDQIAAYRKGTIVDPLGRDFTGDQPFEPPFHAVRVTGAVFHTQGGVLTNEKAQVVTGPGKPLPNLFAGGGAACGVSGPAAQGYLSGNGLLCAVTMGALAGESAASCITR